MKFFSMLFSLITVQIFTLSSPAFAYLDGGTGSMILQVILGGLAGLAVFLKVFWHSILAKLGIRKKDTDKVSSES